MEEPKFKEGQTIYFVYGNQIMQTEIKAVEYVYVTSAKYIFDNSNDLFATREEAENFLLNKREEKKQ